MEERESWLQNSGDCNTLMVRTSSGPYWEHAQGKWNKRVRWDFLRVLHGVSTPMRMGQERRAWLRLFPGYPSSASSGGRSTREQGGEGGVGRKVADKIVLKGTWWDQWSAELE